MRVLMLVYRYVRGGPKKGVIGWDLGGGRSRTSILKIAHMGQVLQGRNFVCFFLAPNGPEKTPKLPRRARNGLNVFKVTSKTIFIRDLLLLRSIWVGTWLVCNKFYVTATNWLQMAQKWPKMISRSSKWLPKPSPLEFCPSCDRFEFSAQNGYFWCNYNNWLNPRKGQM